MVDRLAKLGLSQILDDRSRSKRYIAALTVLAGSVTGLTEKSRNIRGLATDAGSAYPLPSKTWNVARGSKE